MPTRRISENRCDLCRLYQPLCICSEIPRIELKTRLLVLMHWREKKLTTNTGSLACMALPNSEIRIRGEKGKLDSPRNWLPDEHPAAILFPSQDAIELTEEVAADLPRPLTLIVADGSWRQARKIAHRVEALPGVIRLKLPQGGPSIYRLRHSPHAQNLATIEAIARALGTLEGGWVQEKLERLLLLMVERRLWSRGQLPADQCSTGIPDAAFEAMRLAGFAGRPKRV